jgi:hypothetical protein
VDLHGFSRRPFFTNPCPTDFIPGQIFIFSYFKPIPVYYYAINAAKIQVLRACYENSHEVTQRKKEILVLATKLHEGTRIKIKKSA